MRHNARRSAVAAALLAGVALLADACAQRGSDLDALFAGREREAAALRARRAQAA